jgi:hypothetical protein
MLMRLAGASRFHAVDVKSRSWRKCIVKLQETLSDERLSINKKRLKGRGVDIGDDPLGFFHLAHCGFRLTG